MSSLNLPPEYQGGVNTLNPVAQRKYAADGTLAAGIETQARLYVTLPQKAREALLASKAGTNRFRPVLDQMIGDMGYVDFALTGVSEGREERLQAIELLGDRYVAYYFGERIPTYSYNGVFLNTVQNDWWQAFSYLYEELLRGSRLAQYGGLVHLRYDTRVISGSLLSFQSSMSAQSQMSVDFSFQMLVSQVSYLDMNTNVTPTSPASPFALPGFDAGSFVTQTTTPVSGNSGMTAKDMASTARSPAEVENTVATNLNAAAEDAAKVSAQLAATTRATEKMQVEVTQANAALEAAGSTERWIFVPGVGIKTYNTQTVGDTPAYLYTDVAASKDLSIVLASEGPQVNVAYTVSGRAAALTAARDYTLAHENKDYPTGNLDVAAPTEIEYAQTSAVLKKVTPP